MKHFVLIFSGIILLSFSVKAQDNAPAWDYLNVTQINPNINIQLGKQHENFMDGQAYVGVITNVSTKYLHITGFLVAYLTCGNQVSTKFDITLKPGEKAGGGTPALLNMDGLGDHAMNTDCLGEKKYPDPVNNPTHYYLDRIKAVGIKDLSVTIIADDGDNSVNNSNSAAAINQQNLELAQRKQRDLLTAANTELTQRRYRDSVTAANIAYQNERKRLHHAAADSIEANKARNQAALASGIGGMTNLVSKGIASNTAVNFFHGNSVHFGIDIGFVSPNIPIVINETSTGLPNDSHIQSPAQMGAGLGLHLDPIMSNYFTLGIQGSGVYAVSTSFLTGGGVSTSTGLGDVTSSESMSTLNYNYGAQVALGLKKIKLLGGYFINSYNSTYTYTSTSDLYVGSSTITTNINKDGSAVYTAQRIEGGLRLGNYEDICVDLIYGQESFKDYNSKKLNNNIYKITIWKPSFFKIFVEYSNKYAAYGANDYNWQSTGEDKRHMLLNFGILYNKDWFW